MSTLADFKSLDHDAIVRQAADMLERIKDLHDAGKITDDQYQELGRNALTVQDSNLRMLDMHQRQAIYEAFQKLAVLAGIIIKTFL